MPLGAMTARIEVGERRSSVPARGLRSDLRREHDLGPLELELRVGFAPGLLARLEIAGDFEAGPAAREGRAGNEQRGESDQMGASHADPREAIRG